MPGGTATAPGLAWIEDADATPTGIYRPSTNSIGFLISGLVVSRINSDGINLGSGTVDSVFNRGGTTGSLRFFGGTTPTQSAATCGTGPTIAGNNTNGSVILGTGPTLPCAIVFNGTWTNAPRCYLNPEILTTGTTTVRATSITTTGFIITSTAALVATDKVSWLCVSS